jgi:hypothetical protein
VQNRKINLLTFVFKSYILVIVFQKQLCISFIHIDIYIYGKLNIKLLDKSLSLEYIQMLFNVLSSFFLFWVSCREGVWFVCLFGFGCFVLFWRQGRGLEQY